MQIKAILSFIIKKLFGVDGFTVIIVTGDNNSININKDNSED